MARGWKRLKILVAAVVTANVTVVVFFHKMDSHIQWPFAAVPMYTDIMPQLSCKEKAKLSLKGQLSFAIDKIPPSINLSTLYGGFVHSGGHWRPANCENPSKVAILVPYRNRPEQLEVFLSHMHPIFRRQMLDYRIFVVEQTGNAPFNKGAIYNIGFKQSLAYGNFTCCIFHDIDLLCENDKNFYDCPSSPMHLSPAIDKFKYKLSYPTLIGGIQAIKMDHYIKMNGYSNKFWGWGAEDDDLYSRILATGLNLARPDMMNARYKMNQRYHYRSDGWSQTNAKLLRKRRPRREIDGVNSINSLNYTLKESLMPLFTLISIDLKKGL